jgi:hypothetical protein
MWLISEGHYDWGNPIVNRLHRQQMIHGTDSFISAIQEQLQAEG